MKAFYADHAISPKIGNARPYIRYRQGDPDRIVREAWRDSPRFAAMIARQAPGIVIPRYAPPFPSGLSHVPAELRPDEEVWTGSHPHYHGDFLIPEGLIAVSDAGTPLPKKWSHTPWEMRTHIADKGKGGHGGVNVQEVHTRENWAKYVFPSGDKGAKRLDLHPREKGRLVTASRVFFGIEGCIKADAMLSAGEAVLSVPSVTLWLCPELLQFLPLLRGKRVYIVPDADWMDESKRGAVITQALLCRSYLRKHGVNAKVAAPPLAAFKRNNKLKGIDDFLADGGRMDDMDVLERETPYTFLDWLSDRGKWRDDRAVRAAETLKGLAVHAGPDGAYDYSLRALSRATGISKRRVEPAVRDLDEVGAVEIEGDLATATRWHGSGLEWRDRPRIIVDRELRATQTVHRLGDD